MDFKKLLNRTPEEVKRDEELRKQERVLREKEQKESVFIYAPTHFQLGGLTRRTAPKWKTMYPVLKEKLKEHLDSIGIRYKKFYFRLNVGFEYLIFCILKELREVHKYDYKLIQIKEYPEKSLTVAHPNVTTLWISEGSSEIDLEELVLMTKDIEEYKSHIPLIDCYFDMLRNSDEVVLMESIIKGDVKYDLNDTSPLNRLSGDWLLHKCDNVVSVGFPKTYRKDDYLGYSLRSHNLFVVYYNEDNEIFTDFRYGFL